MGNVEKQIVEKLKRDFNPLALEITNESVNHHRKPGSESHFKVILVSELFVGVSSIDRHRKVYTCLELEMKTVHMLALKTLTPQEWEKFDKSTFVPPKHG